MVKLISHFDYLIIYGALLLVPSTSYWAYGASVDKKSISSAFFIFGDSIVDPGNNNYIDTTPDKRADYKPYGQNGYFEGPTGRFSNGRVIVDFIGRLVISSTKLVFGILISFTE